MILLRVALHKVLDQRCAPREARKLRLASLRPGAMENFIDTVEEQAGLCLRQLVETHDALVCTSRERGDGSVIQAIVDAITQLMEWLIENWDELYPILLVIFG